MKMCIQQIHKFLFLILFSTLLFTSQNLAQLWDYYDCVPEEFDSPAAIQPGGRYIPSKDTFHVLIVFVEFPDDNFDINNPMWQKGQPPSYINTFFDSVASQTSDRFLRFWHFTFFELVLTHLVSCFTVFIYEN